MPKPKITKTKKMPHAFQGHHWTYTQEEPHIPTIKFLSSPHRLCSAIPCACGKVK